MNLDPISIHTRPAMWLDNLRNISRCYVVAEIGNNHQGSLTTAARMIAVAKQSGADAVKLQKRHNRTLYAPCLYDQAYDNPNSFGDTYGEHREALELSPESIADLLRYAREQVDIDLFTTVFDEISLEQMDRIGIPVFKLASGSLKDRPLIEAVVATGRPFIVSTGGGVLGDVLNLLDWVGDARSRLVLLHCTAEYPARYEHLNLRVIPEWRSRWPDIPVGWSGHDNGIAMATVAYTLGARIIEKHFTLDRSLKGTDHAFSLEPQGLTKMVRDLRRTELALGSGVKRTYPEEAGPLSKMSRGIRAARRISTGQVITKDDVCLQSPGGELGPDQLGDVVGRVCWMDFGPGDTIGLFELGQRREE